MKHFKEIRETLGYAGGVVYSYGTVGAEGGYGEGHSHAVVVA